MLYCSLHYPSSRGTISSRGHFRSFVIVTAMGCPRCGAEVGNRAKFCIRCGFAFAPLCPSCGASNDADSNFCSECGARLSGGALEPREVLPERRHLTVMFCDLVDSTGLSTRLDLEDLQQVLGAYQKRVSEVISEHDGFIARRVGDGVLTYFGFPRVREDDAEQAVRAAMAIIDAVGKIQVPERLQVRIGIATAVVVVDESAGEQEVLGWGPNLAARLQALAEP